MLGGRDASPHKQTRPQDVRRRSTHRGERCRSSVEASPFTPPRAPPVDGMSLRGSKLLLHVHQPMSAPVPLRPQLSQLSQRRPPPDSFVRRPDSPRPAGPQALPADWRVVRPHPARPDPGPAERAAEPEPASAADRPSPTGRPPRPAGSDRPSGHRRDDAGRRRWSAPGPATTPRTDRPTPPGRPGRPPPAPHPAAGSGRCDRAPSRRSAAGPEPRRTRRPPRRPSRAASRPAG